MGSSERPPLLTVTKGPGPASYKLPSKVGEGPKVLLHGKRQKDKVEQVPGPGAYNPNHKASFEHYSGIALSTGPRVEKDYSTKRDVPGPGHYKLGTTLNGPKFGYIL